MSGKNQTYYSNGRQMSEGMDNHLRDKTRLDASWKALFVFTSRKHTLTIAVGSALTLFAGLTIPSFAICLGNLFDSFTKFGAGVISGSQLLSEVYDSCLTLLGLGVVGWCINGSYFIFWVIFGELQATGARKRLFRDLLKQEVRWFDMRKEGIGAFLSQAQKQVRELQIATSQPLGFTLQYLVRTIAATGLAFYTSWKVALVTVAAVPFSSAIISFLSSRMTPIIEAQQSKLTEASKLSYDAFTAVETVKCFNGQSSTHWRFSSCIKEAARSYLKLALLSSLQVGVTQLVSFGMFVQGFWFGSSLVESGQLSSGEVLRTFWACLIAIQSIEEIVNQLPALERGKIAGATLKSYLYDSGPEAIAVADRGARHPTFCRGDIEVREVSFAYPSQTERLVLECTNISFPAGKTTFIIGQSGSGKSTLASLLLRFYSPCSGEILIDGNPIQKIDARWICNNITLVQQQRILFNETILQNIIFGSKDKSNVTRQQIEACIETANLQDVISHLPEGLETVVGIRGNLLSGGQKQRVAIARARLRDSPILILDECTSALDSKNQIAVMDAIRTWRKGKTTIIIAHDTTQILESDFTYVLENGHVIDSGYRRDLIGRNPTLFSGEEESSSNAESSDSIIRENSSSDCSLEFSDNSVPPSLKPPRWKPEPDLHGHQMGSLQKILLTIPSTLGLKRRRLLMLALVCAILHASASPIFSYLLSRLFQAFYAEGNRANLATRWSLALLGLAVGDAIVSFVMQYLLEYCSQVWIDSLRNEAMRRILDQPCSWFEAEENKPLYLTACLDQNAEEIRNLVGRFAGAVLIAAVTTIMAGVWSSVLCWKLTLAGLACGPFIYAITKGLDSVSRKCEAWSNDIDIALTSIFSETFSDICTVRAFTLESYFSSKHSEILRKAMTLTLKRAGYPGIFFGLGESVIIFASALIFYYGAVLTSSGEFTATDVMSVFAMILFSMGYVNTVISWIPQINSACDTATRLLRLSRLPFASSHEHVGKQRVFEPVPIQFSNLEFRYPQRPEALVLPDFSLTIPANSCTALVGCSGSGKSTIASLLLGLYPSSSPIGGPPAITLGGVDIRKLHLLTLRSLIAVVPQQPRLFADTIRANITYGLDPYSRLNSMKNIRAAAHAAGIDEFICSLPEGYSTLVGDGGLGLSDGQAQRLVIGRAIIRQPRILILDEATSHLDRESAETIRRSIRKLMASRQGLTVVVITHAREMMEMADNVVVIDRGSVVEQGPYHTLWRDARSKLREMLAGPEDALI